jgi:prepilin-type processing-associated H-X9-DG protein
VLSIIAVLAALIVAAVTSSRRASAKSACGNNLRQLAVGLQSHHATHGQLPPGVTRDHKDGSKSLKYITWQARLLPQLGETALWQAAVAAYDAEPQFWKNPPHSSIAVSLPIFLCPADSRAVQAQFVEQHKSTFAFTSFLGVLGVNDRRKDGVLYCDSSIAFSQVTDGTSQTLMVGERPPSADLAYGWWYAGHGLLRNGDADSVLGARPRCYGFSADVCDEGPYHFQAGTFQNQCDAFHFWSPHAGGAHFAFCDGSVRFLRYSADAVLPMLATRAGGESVGDFE